MSQERKKERKKEYINLVRRDAAAAPEAAYVLDVTWKSITAINIDI
jgi:hypothetical protein